MKYLGVDYGSKRVGLAVSSENIAFPRGVIPNDASLLDALVDIVAKERIGKIVIGDTRSFGGHDNRISKNADAFVDVLKKRAQIPVEMANETGSSIEASRYAPTDAKQDDAAAAIILQRYLDMHGSALQ